MNCIIDNSMASRAISGESVTFSFQFLSCCLEGGSVVHRLCLQDVDLHARVGHVDEVRHIWRSDDNPVVVLNHLEKL